MNTCQRPRINYWRSKDFSFRQRFCAPYQFRIVVFFSKHRVVWSVIIKILEGRAASIAR